MMEGWHPLGSVKGWTGKRKKVLLRREPYAPRAYEAVFPYFRKVTKVVSPRVLVEEYFDSVTDHCIES